MECVLFVFLLNLTSALGVASLVLFFFSLYSQCNEVKKMSFSLKNRIGVFEKITVKAERKRLHSSSLHIKKCWALNTELFQKTLSFGNLEKILWSFQWSVLEISMLKHVSVLNQWSIHILTFVKKRSFYF